MNTARFRDWFEDFFMREENLKDIPRVVDWSQGLGENDNKLLEILKHEFFGGLPGGSESLVLVIRGDLLRRYPGALIYAVDAVNELPGLPEYQRKLFFSIFLADMPPDLTFLGFPFDKNAAKDMFFIIEQPMSHPRFGLDEKANENGFKSWNDLSWRHFKVKVTDGQGLEIKRDIRVGEYLDDAILEPAPPTDDPGRSWDSDDATSATRARITLRNTVRVAVRASQLIPTPLILNPVVES